MEEQYFTPEGLEKLKKEAKEEGDISENAAFDSAKESQAVNEGRIEEIKATLENVKVVSGSSGKSTVDVGSEVKVESKNGIQTFIILGAAETDPLKGFISNESPLGKAFIGRKKGDNLKIKIPKGEVEYKMLEVK